MTVATLGAFAINQYEEAVGVMLFYRIGEYLSIVRLKKSWSDYGSCRYASGSS